VCAGTLCHLGEIDATSAAAATSALRPGGVLVATVERLVEPVGDWRMTPSGRYAHSDRYVRAVGAAAGLEDVELTRVHLGLEAGAPVEGLLWSARRPGQANGATGARQRATGGDNRAGGGKDGRVGVD
jgi:predicted TPR repeat methyltransferase